MNVTVEHDVLVINDGGRLMVEGVRGDLARFATTPEARQIVADFAATRWPQANTAAAASGYYVCQWNQVIEGGQLRADLKRLRAQLGEVTA